MDAEDKELAKETTDEPVLTGKVALPCVPPGGLGSKLGIHFGRSGCFTIVDLSGGQASATVLDMAHHDSCVGVVQLLRRHGVGLIATRHMGQRPLLQCLAAGMKVCAVDAVTVGEAIEQLRGGALRPMSIDDACRGDSPPHGHGQHHGGRGCNGHGRGAGPRTRLDI